MWHALDENEREHPKTGKRDRDEETIGNEFFKCPHDPNPLFDQLCTIVAARVRVSDE